MEDDKRRLFALIGLIVATIGIGIGIYFVFFKSDKPPEVTPAVVDGTSSNLELAEGQREPNSATVVPEGNGTLTLAPDEPSEVADGGLTKTTELVPTGARKVTAGTSPDAVQYYDPQSGLFHRILPDGTNETMNDTPLPNARAVNWSNGSDKAIVEFPDGANVLYDFDTKEQRTLPTHWTEFSFSPTDVSIAAKKLGLSPENRHLIIANPDGTGAKNIEFLGENASKVQISWSPNDQIIGFSHTGEKVGLGREEILLVGKNNENFRSITVEGLGFQSKWSTEGDTLLYSVFSSRNNLLPELWITNSNPDTIGQNRQPIGITTWVEKCTFANNDTVYCAVPDPDTLPYGIGFQPRMAVNTDDSIYKIDLKTGSTVLVGKPEQNFTIEQLVVSDDESILYFNDRITGSLQKMLLK